MRSTGRGCVYDCAFELANLSSSGTCFDTPQPCCLVLCQIHGGFSFDAPFVWISVFLGVFVCGGRFLSNAFSFPSLFLRLVCCGHGRLDFLEEAKGVLWKPKDDYIIHHQTAWRGNLYIYISQSHLTFQASPLRRLAFIDRSISGSMDVRRYLGGTLLLIYRVLGPPLYGSKDNQGVLPLCWVIQQSGT